MEVVMPDLFKTLVRGVLAIPVLLAATGAALAQAEAQAPSISGESWVAIAIVVGLALLIFLFIGGALSISKRDKSSADDGTGIIGAEEEDD
jgi:hypothetical protein